MSWFDTAGIANLAKSALKEAQKTIDKALDIKDEEAQKSGKLSAGPSPTSGDANSESFFSTWGLSSAQGGAEERGEGTAPSAPDPPSKRMTTSASLWGSFTGSFFENPKTDDGGDKSDESRSGNLVSSQPKKSIPSRSLSLDLAYTSTPARGDVTAGERGGAKPTTSYCKEEAEQPVSNDDNDDDEDAERMREEIRNFPQVEVVMRRRPGGEQPRNVNNRLSVISSESDRRSSDSCDVIGSTPDSEPVSVMSSSSSTAPLRHSGSFESVEVLTSPSSVDVLGSASSVTSPGDQKYSSDSISPVAEGDGVEVIPEDEDDVSVEDSYTSASETTLTVTVLEHGANLMLKSTSSLDTSFSETISPRESITRVSIGQSRVGGDVAGGSDVGTVSVVTQPPRPSDTGERDVITKPPRLSAQHQEPSRLDLTETRVSDHSLSAGSDGEAQLVDTSSCEEGTIMGSSSEGETTVQSEKHPTQSSHSSETCITNMLAEAMTEPQPTHQQPTCGTTHLVPREQSPISSERSDLVKIGSSEHTSGDELETTTSSDIEIISSPTPNGDSSSTTSRHSPSKLAFRGMSLGKIITGKMKGHHREPSETSSGGSDECTEVDKLLKRIAEMTEILEARESKLIDLSRLNADLQESNSELKSQLERHIESQEVRTMSEEFTQRMAALERKFQQAIREKDLLRKQLDHAKALATKREDDVDKDQLIAELRSEGEKLSKQQLTLNNTIKKLRASEKENSKTIATLREQLNDVTQELERCKKAVLAKEEMERSHIEAVHNLTKQNQQLEKELTNAKSNIAGLTSSLVSLQKEFSEKEEACKVLENKNAVERKEIENKIRNELASDLEAAEQQVLTLQSALEEMRRQILLIQEQHSQSEAVLRREMSDLVRRAEAAEQRAEEQAEALTVASQPLTRQLQALAESHSAASTAWQLHEAALNKTISELESRLTILGTSERSVREQYETVGAQLASLQDKMTSLVHQNNELNKELKESQESSTKLEEEKSKIMKKYEMDFEKLNNEMCDTKRELITLQELLSVERAAVEAEKRKNSALQERLHSMQSRGSPPLSSASPRSSPTLSFGRVSVSDSVSSSAWPVLGEDFGESGSISGRIYEALRPCNNTSYLETLQAQVKLKEGEIQQLQWELSKLNADRNALSAEVSELTTQVSEQSEELESLSLLRTQYDALLQMYGEKLEESEELRMDLQDVKDMYKAQIDELLKKEPTPPPTS